MQHGTCEGWHVPETERLSQTVISQPDIVKKLCTSYSDEGDNSKFRSPLVKMRRPF